MSDRDGTARMLRRWSDERKRLRRERDEARARIAQALAVIAEEDDPDAPGRPWLVANVVNVLRGWGPQRDRDGKEGAP